MMIERPNARRSSHGRAGRIAAALLAALLVPACDDVISPQLEFAAAEQAVDRWVQTHPSGWSLELRTSRSLTQPSWSKGCADNPDGFRVLRHAAADTEIDLFFRCPLGADPGVEDLAAAFAFVVLQELPHGIRSSGWRFRVLTPSSSVSETVSFSSPTAGRLLVEVRTPLFAVYGHSHRRSCEPPQDAPSPEGCYLQRVHSVPLNLSLEVPFAG